MTFFLRRKNAQRKYISLIEESSSKWANWSPARNIHAGDFGTIDKRTGDLMIEGNIYTHDDISQIAEQHRPVHGAEVDHYLIQSHKVRGLGIETNTGDVPSIVFQARWQFKNDRGAILVMHRPRMTWVPDTFFNASLHLPILKGKCVVYQVWDCPGFYMYLSGRSNEQVTVSLRENIINPPAGVRITFTWFAEGSSGVRQHAYRPDAVYTPLFCLRSIRKPFLRRAKVV